VWKRTRFALKQGGAVELVSKRWVGLGGEKLDRQGVVPDQVLKVADTEDPLAKVLTALAIPAPKHEASKPEGAPLPGPATGPAPVPPKGTNPLMARAKGNAHLPSPWWAGPCSCLPWAWALA